MNRRNGRGRSRSGRGRGGRGQAMSVQRWVGPPATSLNAGPAGRSMPPGSANNTEMFKTRLATFASLVTSASGVLEIYVRNNPNDYDGGGTSLQEWSTWSQLFCNYRVLSLSWVLTPRFHNWINPSTSSSTVAPGVISYVLQQNVNTPNTYGDAAQLGSARMHAGDVVIRRSVHMNASLSSTWLPTGAPSSNTLLGLYAERFPASATVYDAMVSMVVQFRGRF